MLDKERNFFPIKAFKQHWTQAEFSYMKEPRPDNGIMLVLNGQIEFVSSQNEILSAFAGNILFLPKNSYYEARFRTDLGEVDNYLINFETDKGFDCTKPMLISERVSASCADMFGRFVDESFNSDGMDLRSKGLFYLLWDSILCQNRSHRSDTDKLIDKVKSLLKKSEDIPISRIARECSVSVSGLRRSFTELVGMSPMQYRLKEKFKRARYLLEATDMSVGEISDCLNFYDAAYFCRAFRKETGISPREYRKNKKL